MRRSMAELSQMLEFRPPGCCRAHGESGGHCRIHPHIPLHPPARSHLRGIPGVHGLHDGRVLQLVVDDEPREPLCQRVLGIAQNIPVIPNGTVRLPARPSLVLQLRQPLVGLLPVIICKRHRVRDVGRGDLWGQGDLRVTLRVSPTAPAPKVSSLNWSMSSSSSPRAWKASSSSSSGQSSRDWDSREQGQLQRDSQPIIPIQHPPQPVILPPAPLSTPGNSPHPLFLRSDSPNPLHLPNDPSRPRG